MWTACNDDDQTPGVHGDGAVLDGASGDSKVTGDSKTTGDSNTTGDASATGDAKTSSSPRRSRAPGSGGARSAMSAVPRPRES